MPRHEILLPSPTPMSSDTIAFTREELYEQVWLEPMSLLSRKLGLSDVGLAKVCRKLRVPTPGRGYWARKSAGQRVRRTLLPKLYATALIGKETVTFKLRRDQLTDKELEDAGPIAKRERFEQASENRIVVAERLEHPHQLVARSVLALRRAKRDDRGYLKPKSECLDAHVTLDSSDRAMCILDALIKALEARGYPTTIGRNGETIITSIRIAEEDVAIKISEQIDRVERKADQGKRAHWSLPQYEWIPTGKLTLRIDHGLIHGERQSWSDGKQQRIENCLNRFIIGIVVVAEQMRLSRLGWAEQERQRIVAEEQRLLERERQEEEAARVRALMSAVSKRQTAREVRSYLLDVRRSLVEEPAMSNALTEWLKWAEAFADRIDPLLPAPSVPVDPEPRQRSRYEW